MVNGVAQVSVFGSQKYAVRAQIDPNALASRQIGLDEVASAIRAGNNILPNGVLYGPKDAYTIRSNSQLTSAADFSKLVVAYRNGSPVRLNELGNVLDSVQENKIASWFSGTRAIVLAIQRQPGTNTVEVVDAVKKLMPMLERQIPAAVFPLPSLPDRIATPPRFR